MFDSSNLSETYANQFVPLYQPPHELQHNQDNLKPQIPLVSIREIKELQQLLAKASIGEHFLIQIGDCADGFHQCGQDTTKLKLEFIHKLVSFFYKKTGQKMIQVAGLPLHYDQALTRLDECTGLYYNLSTPFLWLGEGSINSIQHINDLKKVANPIAIKIGPDLSIKNLLKTVNKLDPDFLPGRITLIPCLGARYVNGILPQLIDAIQKTHRHVLWSCDPMHGNTDIKKSGIRIRKLCNIVDEIKDSFLIHQKMGSQLNAIYLEATHEDVTECVSYGEDFDDSEKKYNSLLEPRLNYEQTVHVIQLVAKNYVNY